jgi:hypothetical protein
VLRAIPILAVLAALLTVWDRALDERLERSRSDTTRIGRLVPKEQRESRPVAALRLVSGGGESHLYVHTAGVWRCASWRRAVASREGLESLITKLLEAEGHVQSEDPARQTVYGLGLESTHVVFLHGPGVDPRDATRDVIAAIEVGSSVPGLEGAFVRRRGERAVWAIDVDPNELLRRREGERVPPLLEPAMVPGSWAGRSMHPRRIVVQGREGASYALELHQLPITPEELREGKPGFEWILARGGGREVAHLALATSYASFLVRAPWVDVVDPAAAREVDFDRPAAQVTLEPAEGEAVLVLLAEERGSQAAALVHVTLSGSTFAVDAALESLLFPDPERLLAPAEGAQPENPWESWLR